MCPRCGVSELIHSPRMLARTVAMALNRKLYFGSSGRCPLGTRRTSLRCNRGFPYANDAARPPSETISRYYVKNRQMKTHGHEKRHACVHRTISGERKKLFLQSTVRCSAIEHIEHENPRQTYDDLKVYTNGAVPIYFRSHRILFVASKKCSKCAAATRFSGRIVSSANGETSSSR